MIYLTGGGFDPDRTNPETGDTLRTIGLDPTPIDDGAGHVLYRFATFTPEGGETAYLYAQKQDILDWAMGVLTMVGGQAAVKRLSAFPVPKPEA